MMKYEDPKLNVIHFDIADILTASDPSGSGFELPEHQFGEGKIGD